MRSVPGQKLGL